MAGTGRRKARGAVGSDAPPSGDLAVLGPQDLVGGGAIIDGTVDGGPASAVAPPPTSLPVPSLAVLPSEEALTSAGLTARVASATFERDGYKHLIKAAEAVYSYPANGARLSLPAQKMLNFMIHLAGSQNFANKLYRLPKRVVRGNHKGNERIFDALKEIFDSSLVVIGPFRGRRSRAELRILSSYVRPEEEEDSDAADIHFQFTDAFLEIQRSSQLWAKLSGPAMVKVTSTYALKLYEIGMQRYQMDFPSLELDIDTLRKLLNVPEGAYKDFGILRTRTIDRAIAEVNQLAPFRVTMPDDKMKRKGRKVEAVTLDFLAKDEEEAAETYLERERHSAGRRARRIGSVDQVAPVGPVETGLADLGPLPDADDVSALWAAVLHALKGKVPAPLLSELTPDRVEDTPQGGRRLVLTVRKAAVADTARMNHWPTFKSALSSLTSGLIEDVTFEAAVRRTAKAAPKA
ncbi:RepB family plasmid replication initiator protein [Azospirillum cavernae]|uniref:RepB family plasmid replication initiator protein n=1 Tax=Azospirillum cavernae TaxID=2320860 RepID=A0A418VPP0_9PROT|nr:replication initiation protein [Azospirillum cavernae]RJF78159.1 RepB family plasmid replication initiator protein [Azospirillum cavernae]